MADYSSSSSSEAEFEEEALMITLLLRRRRYRRLRANFRKIWARPWILRRTMQGVFSNLLRELDCEAPAKLRQFHHLDRHEFEYILAKMEQIIRKEETYMRQSISAGERLSITLRLLATGKLLKNNLDIKLKICHI